MSAWETRLQRTTCWLCCTGTSNASPKHDHKNALPDVARLISEFFENRDFVPSDLIAGLVLLQQKQKKYRQNQKIQERMICGRSVRSDTFFLDPAESVTMRLVEQLSYYMIYAHAAYGFGAIFLEHGICPLMTIAADQLSCCRQQYPINNIAASGSTANSSRTIFLAESLRRSKVGPNMELVYISWDCEVTRQPFFVAVDHLKQSIVIAIRGTMSGSDVLTDMKGATAPIGHGVPGKGHQGRVFLNEVSEILYLEYGTIFKIKRFTRNC